MTVEARNFLGKKEDNSRKDINEQDSKTSKVRAGFGLYNRSTVASLLRAFTCRCKK